MFPRGIQASNLATAPISDLSAQSCCIDFTLYDAEGHVTNRNEVSLLLGT